MYNESRAGTGVEEIMLKKESWGLEVSLRGRALGRSVDLLEGLAPSPARGKGQDQTSWRGEGSSSTEKGGGWRGLPVREGL